MLTGKKMDKIEWGPNWEDDLGGEFAQRAKDALFEGIQKEMYSTFENTFMMYLPRLCEHCLNPTCVASCPSGSIYKREDDGIVLIDQDKCRGWRMCISGCPYKRFTTTGPPARPKVHLLLPAHRSRPADGVLETCVGRIRYLGVLLYDADKIEHAASVADPKDLYESQLKVFLDPNAPEVIAEAKKQASPTPGSLRRKIPGVQNGDGMESRLPLTPGIPHPADGVVHPPLSPIQSAMENNLIGEHGIIPSVKDLRIPIQYLANLLTAGKEEPVIKALETMVAMRRYMRKRAWTRWWTPTRSGAPT